MCALYNSEHSSEASYWLSKFLLRGGEVKLRFKYRDRGTSIILTNLTTTGPKNCVLVTEAQNWAMSTAEEEKGLGALIWGSYK